MDRESPLDLHNETNGHLVCAAHVHVRHGGTWHTHTTIDNVGGERGDWN